MPGGIVPTHGRRLNPLFPLAAESDERKQFNPLQAVQRFAADVKSKFDKPKPKSDTATAIDAVAAATQASPSQGQIQARNLISSLSNKGFVLAKTQPIDPDAPKVTNPAAIISKEELGRATWIFLHTLAVQYPKSPTKQQQKDVKTLVGAKICSESPNQVCLKNDAASKHMQQANPSARHCCAGRCDDKDVSLH